MRYSIIIPHHDIPELLVRCLRSIPQRDDVQVIVVDDCSPGAERYLTDYPELSRPGVELYTTSQAGSAGRARNVGLDHARGEWLLFADADDFFDTDFLTQLDRYATTQADLVYFRTRSVMSDDVTQPATRSEWLNVLWQDYERNHHLPSLCGRCPVVWGKMFRRSLAEQHHVRFDETRYSNDFWFSANMACLAASRVEVSSAVIYVATVRQGSLAHGMNQKPGELEERAEVCFRVQGLLFAHGIKTLPYEPFDVYMHQLFDKRRDLYYHYFRLMPTIGYSRRMALREMCHGTSRRHKLYVWLVSYLCSYPFSIIHSPLSIINY